MEYIPKNDKNLDYLYKFRSMSKSSVKYVENIFLKNELYFSSPLHFNDPFDCSPKYTLENVTKNELKEYFNKMYKREMPNLSREERRKAVAELSRNKAAELKRLELTGRELLEKIGVCSFTERYDHVLMWSHYADSHKGICLRFKATNNTPFFFRAQKVNYQEEYPKVNMINDAPETITNSSILTKAYYWNYEQEWRITEFAYGIYNFPAEVFDGVILGALISEDNKNRVLEWVKSRKTPMSVYKANLHNDRYQIVIEQVM